MKALTKPEKFQVMSRIYGYECNDILENEDDVACDPTGREEIEVDCVWDTEIGECVPVYDCVDVEDPDINEC
ncbi:hypothetical protein F4Y43_06980 [Candidatus Poribacteria bacterium]|nr:hypothetical protein [Candidatus Poribacteria bacterium]